MSYTIPDDIDLARAEIQKLRQHLAFCGGMAQKAITGNLSERQMLGYCRKISDEVRGAMKLAKKRKPENTNAAPSDGE